VTGRDLVPQVCGPGVRPLHRRPSGCCRILNVYGPSFHCLPRERLICMGEEMSVRQREKAGQHFTRKSSSELDKRGRTVGLEKRSRWSGLMPYSDKINSGRMGTLVTVQVSFERGTRRHANHIGDKRPYTKVPTEIDVRTSTVAEARSGNSHRGASLRGRRAGPVDWSRARVSFCHPESAGGDG